ncbi:hypothetical protein Tco_1558825, partial [Tanacetum coccineum]
IGSAEDEKLIKRMNERGVDLSKSEVIKEESKEDVQKEDKDEERTRKRKLDDKAEHLEEINQNVVIRSNGQKRYFSTLMRVLSIFDREDLNAVYQLVMDRYQGEIPKGFDKVLWGDLMVMFNPDDKDEFWNSQQDWNIGGFQLTLLHGEELASPRSNSSWLRLLKYVDS